MPSQRPTRPAMYNTPHIRNGGFGALQVEAMTNRPLSIARRHLAASTLRMRDIEPDELSSSEWVQFLVMPEHERERWMTSFLRRRRNSDGSNSSSSPDRQTEYDKAEEARLEAQEARQANPSPIPSPPPPTASSSSSQRGRTPLVSIFARAWDDSEDAAESFGARRPMHRRAATDMIMEAPPTYESAVRARTPPPAYEPRSEDEGPHSPRSP
ncbi:hypothetical protein EJ03DRAFT_91886 [Teratosphaeria nubilosa]|uniref:Uncharacterized protein n=1 Tax=Teratosphaeria nubilosa TaxID=161662 RepID=A0A6G1LAJ0_9PEZI|nr:hypothetical protein EJ03DRAFT_91886 [Teratosphaeria nubilosa]